MTYQLVKFIGWFFLRLSPSTQLYLAKLLGLLYWLVLSQKRKNIAIKNISSTLIMPKQAARKIAKKSVSRFGKMFTDMLRYPRFTKDNISQILRIHGAENLDNALALGNGVVMATGHYGNWELLGTGLAFYGYPMVAVARRQQQNNGFERFLCEYRTMAGGKILYTTEVRDIVRVLGENRIPLILFDHDVLQNGVWVDFLGRQTSTPPGAAVLARIKNSPIVPAFITEAPDGTYDLYISPPLTVDRTQDKHLAIQETMQALSHILEQQIRRQPHEWFWIHDRWRPLKIRTTP
ncbi:MAG: lysophospholipid acyltransferase family protein [Pelosinus sp.]|nr:lysophospholipid acyltransferase family protein [Pelosinus sp.]